VLNKIIGLLILFGWLVIGNAQIYFLSTGPLEIEDGTVAVSLHNSSDKAVDLVFQWAFDNQLSTSFKAVELKLDEGGRGGTAVPIMTDELEPGALGYLFVITKSDGKLADSIPLVFPPKKPTATPNWWACLIGLCAAFLSMFVILIFIPQDMQEVIGDIQFHAEQSWGTFTGYVLSLSNTALIPLISDTVDKNALLVLGILFSIPIVIAPLIYGTTIDKTTIKDECGNDQTLSKGKAWAFLITNFTILMGVLLQLSLVPAWFDTLDINSIFPINVGWFTQLLKYGVPSITGILICIYAGRVILQTLYSQQRVSKNFETILLEAMKDIEKQQMSLVATPQQWEFMSNLPHAKTQAEELAKRLAAHTIERTGQLKGVPLI
jgi:hypothetical protein